MPLGIRPTVDFAFKKIFGSSDNSEALIGLLNAILSLPSPIVQVEIRNPFNYQDFSDDKLIIRAIDDRSRRLNIEMQVSLPSSLLQRLTYYACSMYVEQLTSGEGYHKLEPAISICLLGDALVKDSSQPHHRFQMVDLASGVSLPNAIEVHTLELTKYNLDERSIRQASPIEQWVFFLLHADRYDAVDLRQSLVGSEFSRAIDILEGIAHREKDKQMYDHREQMTRTYDWNLNAARAEARAEGLEEGREEGREQGRAQGREQGRVQGMGRGILAGQVRVLQGVLGDSQDSLDHLCQQADADLNQMLVDLQDRLRGRSV